MRIFAVKLPGFLSKVVKIFVRKKPNEKKPT